MITRRSLTALLVALACAVAGGVVWFLALRTVTVGRLDSTVLGEFLGLGGERTERLAEAIASLADPLPFLVFAAALCGTALLRRSPGRALVAALTLAGATITTQALKTLLAAPRPVPGPAEWPLSDASWPSGHATAAMSLALCLVLVCPARWRPTAAAVGGAFGVAVAYSLQVDGWHYASDVIGGFLVASGWFALAIALLRAGEARGDGVPVGVPAAVAPTALTALAGAALAAAVLVLDPLGWFVGKQDLTVFAIALAGIGAAGLAVASVAAAALRHTR
jgi:membrane-associated phospholipid phosphatase